MAYVNITLIFKGDEYDVEVDNASTPDELCRLFMQNLEVEGNYRLFPIDSVEMKNGTTWELSEIAPQSKIKKFEKKSR